MSPLFWPPVGFAFYSMVRSHSRYFYVHPPTYLKISTGEVTLKHRKLPMIQIYIPHNLPILCNILDGRKRILSVSQWYVCILIFSTRTYQDFRVAALRRHSLHTFPILLTKAWHLSRRRDLWRYVYRLSLPSSRSSCDRLYQSSDISRTARFMSSPLVQALTSSAPARVGFPFAL